MADRATRQAKFTITSKSAFNMDELKRVLGDKYADGMTVLTGPTD